MGSSSIASAADQASQDDQQLLVFTMSGEHYALPIMSVREIIRYRQPRTIAAVNSVIEGIINLRGGVLAVCDLRSQLGNPREIGDHTRILIIDTRDAQLGLIVDSVDEVLVVTADLIESSPVSETGLGSQIAKVDDRLIVLIDTERTFANVLGAQDHAAIDDDGVDTPLAA